MLASGGIIADEFKWKVKMPTEASRIIYHYSVDRCPYYGEELSIIGLVEDLGAGKAHAKMLGTHSDSPQCQRMLDELLYIEKIF